MELPELSYEQELLNTPIPFSNRIEFLSDYVKSEAKPMSLRQICAATGMTQRQGRVYVDELKPDVVGLIDGTEEMFEPYTLEVFEDEREWDESFGQLDSYLSIDAMATYLARHRDWVTKNLNGLGVYPSLRQNSQKHLLSLYPKESVWMLRSLSLHFPPANDWWSTDELHEEFHRGHEWIRSTLGRLGVQTSLRTSVGSRVVVPHHAPEARDVLKTVLHEQKPAGDWLTVWGLAETLGKHNSWVKKRIVEYDHLSEE